MGLALANKALTTKFLNGEIGEATYKEFKKTLAKIKVK